MSTFTTLLEGLSFTECPRWRDGRLYFSDRYTRRILALSADGSVETYVRTEGLPAGIGFLPDGRLLITSMRDRKVLRREHNGAIVEHADRQLERRAVEATIAYFLAAQWQAPGIREHGPISERSQLEGLDSVFRVF